MYVYPYGFRIFREFSILRKKHFSVGPGRLLAGLLTVFLIFSMSGLSARAAELAAASKTPVSGDLEAPVVTSGEVSASDIILKGTYAKTYAADAYWDRFSSNYYYSHMNSAARALYEGMFTACENLLLTNVNAGSTGWVQYSGLSEEEATEVLYAFMNSNPQFFFLSNQYSFGTQTSRAGTNTFASIELYPGFANGSARASARETIRAKVDSYLSQINAETTDYAKVKKAHDLLAAALDYDRSGSSTYNQSSAGAFLESSTVCAGYSEGLEMLLRGAGLLAITVTSDEHMGAHEWNEVKVDGAWYCVDLTWDDSGNGDYYFLVSETTLSSRDTGLGEHTPETFYSKFGRPACPADYDRSKAGSSQATTVTPSEPVSPATIPVYRLYNRQTGEHLYTKNTVERNYLIAIGWADEKVAFTAYAYTGTPVYRFFNRIGGEHFYTTSIVERNALMKNAEWSYEYIAFYTPATGKPVYRAFNTTAPVNSHLFTTSAYEFSKALAAGNWRNEGIGWYAVK